MKFNLPLFCLAAALVMAGCDDESSSKFSDECEGNDCQNSEPVCEGDDCDDTEPVSKNCEDECVGSTRDCADSNVMICKKEDDGCYHWTIQEKCGDSKRCDAEKYECVNDCSQTCNPEIPYQCSEQGVLECKTDDNGCASWEIKESCGEGKICDNASFTCITCDLSCGDNPKICTENGIDICTLNEKGCAQWQEIACNSDEICDPEKIECVEQCKKDEVRCNGKSIEKCTENNGKLDWKSESCPDAQYCVESTKSCGYACGSEEDCKPFSIVFLPDTQNYSRPEKISKDVITPRNPKDNRYLDQTNWILSHKDDYNIKFALHLGDITNFNLDSEWKVADAAHKVLDKAGIPYLIATGNHDYREYKYDNTSKAFIDYHDGVYSRTRSLFTKYFNNKRYEGKEWFGGYYKDVNGNYSANSYATFSIGSLKFIMLSLEFSARKEVVCWADDLLTKYKDHYAIITTHNYLTQDGTDSSNNNKRTKKRYVGGSYLPFTANGATGTGLAYELVRRHSNVILVASGHVSGAEFHSETGYADNTYYEMLVDYQSEKPKIANGSKKKSCLHDINAGNGWLRLITIDPKSIKDNALGQAFTPLKKSEFYENTKEFYCSELTDKASNNIYNQNPTNSPAVSFDKYENRHHFTFSLDLSTPADGKYAVKDYSFDMNVANNIETGVQTAPSIAMNPEIGSFLTVWQDNSSDADGKDSKGNPNYDIVGRLFFSGGCANGKQFTINDTTNGNQISPDAAMDKNGNFVVVWTDDSDGNGFGQIYMKGYDDKGNVKIPVVTVNTIADGDQQKPVIAMNPNGQYVVAWEDGSEISGQMQIHIRGFDADGKELFKQRNVSDKAIGTRRTPDIAMADDGSFVVTWADDSDGNGGFQVHARPFNADGTPKLAEFTVNTVSDRQQLDPAIAMNANGDYFIAYVDNADVAGRYIIKARGYKNDNTTMFADQVIHSINEVDEKSAFDSYYKDDGKTYNKYKGMNRSLKSPTICMANNGNAVIGWYGQSVRSKTDKPYLSPEIQRKTINLKNGKYSVSSLATVTYYGYKLTEINNIDRTPAVACSSSGRYVFTWTEILDLAKTSEIYMRGYNSI